ncbi:MAG: hypothetical protein DCC68_22630 [Planctomycetota bacterium]|nr:MAG: hypothetical protein DCC68_22630 [Planctomycetota bacterium]
MATDPEHALDALSHELIHVLFADLFPDSVPPRWAEEGLALLNDPADKQARHRHDLRIALHTGNAIPLSRLFDSANDATVSQRAIYYGQSLSLADYLTQIDEPERFVQFVQACVESGHERALNTVYGIAGVADLERRWRRHALASLSRDGAGLVTTVRLAR